MQPNDRRSHEITVPVHFGRQTCLRKRYSGWRYVKGEKVIQQMAESSSRTTRVVIRKIAGDSQARIHL